jgi:hypothetical protein
MSEENLKKTFDIIRWIMEKDSLNITILGITGGEPTLHPKFWSDVMPTLIDLQKKNPKIPIELHSNASIPIPKEYFQKRYNKIFSKIYVGRDIFHEQFKKTNQLYLDDYEFFAGEVSLRKNAYITGPNEMHSLIRQKGRGADIKITQRAPRRECQCYQTPGYCTLLTHFTPNYIGFCGEKAAKSVVIDDKNAVGYDTPYETIIHKSFDYQQLYSGARCQHPCIADWVSVNDFVNPALDIEF